MARRRLPIGVRRFRDRFRAVVTVEGVRRYGPPRSTQDEAAADSAILRGARVPASLWTLTDALEAVVADVQTSGGQPATADYYRHHARALGANGFGPSRMLHTISVADVESYARQRAAKGLRVALQKELQVLARMFRLALRRGVVARNPFDQIRLPKTKTVRFGWMPAEEVTALIARIRAWPGRAWQRDRDADVIALAFLTGMRRAELGRLRREDIDLEAGNILVHGKTGERHAPITAECRAVLDRLLASHDDDEVVGHWRRVESLFARWRKRLEEPRLKPHVLRHSYGSALARQGVPPHLIRDLLGHTTLTMACRYMQSHGPDLRSAAAKVSLNAHSTPPVAGDAPPA